MTVTDKPMPILSGFEWWIYPRGWLDVIHCTRGNHRRIFTADLHDENSPVHRCSCGATQLAGFDEWISERGGAAKRRKGTPVRAGSVTLVPSGYFDALAASLDEPPVPNEATRDAFRRLDEEVERRP